METNSPTIEQHIVHEVNIRVLNFKQDDLYKKVDKMDSKMETRFLWTISLILTSIVLPIINHYLKLF